MNKQSEKGIQKAVPFASLLQRLKLWQFPLVSCALIARRRL